MLAEPVLCPGRGKLRRELNGLSPECRPVDQGGMKPVSRVVAACRRPDHRVQRRPGVVDVTGGISRFQGVCPPQLPPGRWPVAPEPSSDVGWYPAPPTVDHKCIRDNSRPGMGAFRVLVLRLFVRGVTVVIGWTSSVQLWPGPPTICRARARRHLARRVCPPSPLVSAPLLLRGNTWFEDRGGVRRPSPPPGAGRGR